MRGPDGRSTIRAVPVSAERFVLDGRLDEEIYTHRPPATRLHPAGADAGEPATEKTEVWIFFDDENVYVGCRCWDSRPDRMVANEMRRDSSNICQNENFSVVSTRSTIAATAFFFQTNPLGGVRDALVTDENDDQLRLEHGLGRAGRRDSTAAGRPRWRSRSSRCATRRARAGLGLQRPARRPLRRTSSRYLGRAAALRYGQGALQTLSSAAHAGRHRDAAGSAEPRAQAVRDLRT